VVRRGSGVLSPATHAHPLLSSPFLDDTKRTQHTSIIYEVNERLNEWEIIRSNVFKRTFQNLDERAEEIINVCNNINQEMLQNVFENIKRRVRLCLAENGHHFQHLL
jgi:hypothetical protein